MPGRMLVRLNALLMHFESLIQFRRYLHNSLELHYVLIIIHFNEQSSIKTNKLD